MWKLTIKYTVPGRSEPGTVTRTSEKGFDWDHIKDETWRFTSYDKDWNAVYSRVLWFTEEQMADQVEETNGQEIPIDDGYEGGF